MKLDLGAEPRIYPLIRGNLYVCLTKLPRNFKTKARRGHVELSDVSFWGSRLGKNGVVLAFVEYGSLLLLKNGAWDCLFEVVQ